MRLVSIKREQLQRYTKDKEILQKSNRPCVLVLQLSYKGHRYNFAVPLRSNINPSTPKSQFFSLPPRSATKERHRHGIHYIKMFPVKRQWLIRYRIAGNESATRIKEIIDKHEKQIIKECQQYLKDYEQGIRPKFATNIDLLIEIMKNE